MEAASQMRFGATMNRRKAVGCLSAGRTRQIGADRYVEILDALCADILEVHRQCRAHILVSGARQAHRSRRGDALHPGRDVYRIAKKIAAPRHDLADVQANAETEAALFGNLLIHLSDSLLDAESALECIDRTREFSKNAVTGSIGNAA